MEVEPQRFDTGYKHELYRDLRVRFGAALSLMGFFALGKVAEAIHFPDSGWIYYLAWNQWIAALCFMDLWGYGLGFRSRENFWHCAREMLKARRLWHLPSCVFYAIAFFTHAPRTNLITYVLCLASVFTSLARFHHGASSKD